MEAEFHIGACIGIQHMACGSHIDMLIAPAIVLCVLSHPMLDDANVGLVARLYHGIGTGWRAVVYTACRVPLWLLYTYLVILNPWLLICITAGWLIFDWEWFAFKKQFPFMTLHAKGIGIHPKPLPNIQYPIELCWMYPRIFFTEWGLIPKTIALYCIGAILCSQIV